MRKRERETHTHTQSETQRERVDRERAKHASSRIIAAWNISQKQRQINAQ